MSIRSYQRDRMCKCGEYNLKDIDVIKAHKQFDWIESVFGNARYDVLKNFRIKFYNRSSLFPTIDHLVCFGKCYVANPYNISTLPKYEGGHETNIFIARLGAPFYTYRTDPLLICTEEAARRIHEEPPFGWTILPNKYELMTAKYEQMKDAAMFESRVAEKLSVIPECRDNCTYETISHDMCRRCRIKRARIAAESEIG